MSLVNAISVFGLGKLGASMAASFAFRGYNVIGYDSNPYVVNSLNQGRAFASETGLDELIAANIERIRGTHVPAEAVRNTNISFIVVPTPSDERGAFDLGFARQVCSDLGRALRQKRAYHVFVITSTVLPGSVRSALIPILEQESGLQCGKDFGVCYNPEFIALGSVIRDFLNPDFYLLGQFDDRSGDYLEEVHKRVSLNGAPVRRMSLENAELAKVSLNSFITLKISFANMLSEFCENIPGGDVDVVCDAIGMDKRVGRNYLTGGLGYAGPCFPRDNVALSFFGRHLDVDVSLVESTDAYNRRMPRRLLNDLRSLAPHPCNVSVLGFAYKPRSHITDGSFGLALAQGLAEFGHHVTAHDPLATCDPGLSTLHPVKFTTDLEEALRSADIVILTTTDRVYCDLRP